MIIVYDSLTGQTKRFVSKIGYDVVNIKDYEESNQKVFLVTRSFNFGEIPEPTLKFLEKHSNKVVGTAVSGNRNWGTNFGAAGDKIEKIYNIPLVLKFEGSGFDHDVVTIKTWLEEHMEGNKR